MFLYFGIVLPSTFIHPSDLVMMASANPTADEATEALILQLIAEDFGALDIGLEEDQQSLEDTEEAGFYHAEFDSQIEPDLEEDQQSLEDTEEAGFHHSEFDSQIEPGGASSLDTEDHRSLSPSDSSSIEETDSDAMPKRTRESAGLEPFSPSNSQHPIGNLRIGSPTVESTFPTPYDEATSDFVGNGDDFLISYPLSLGNSKNKRTKVAERVPLYKRSRLARHGKGMLTLNSSIGVSNRGD